MGLTASSAQETYNWREAHSTKVTSYPNKEFSLRKIKDAQQGTYNAVI